MNKSQACLSAIPVVRVLAGVSGYDYADAVADAWEERLRDESVIDPGRELDEMASQAVEELLEYAWSSLSPNDAVDWIDLLARGVIECVGAAPA